jgi:hypothetical protein
MSGKSTINSTGGHEVRRGLLSACSVCPERYLQYSNLEAQATSDAQPGDPGWVGTKQ